MTLTLLTSWLSSRATCSWSYFKVSSHRNKTHLFTISIFPHKQQKYNIWIKSPEKKKQWSQKSSLEFQNISQYLCSDLPRYQSLQSKVRDLNMNWNISHPTIWAAPVSTFIFYSSLNLLYFNYLLRGVYFHSSKRILGEPSETKLKTSLFSDCTCTSIFLRSCWTRYDSCTLMISRRMVWKRRRTSQARAYFCRIRAFCSATIYNNTDSNVWLCDQGQKIIMKRQTMWLCLSVALAGQPSSGEGLYGDYSPQDELVNPPHQIATTVSLNHHRSPGLLQQQSGHSASAAEKFLMYSKCSVWWKRTFLHFICAIL